jgi:hypothetical protein
LFNWPAAPAPEQQRLMNKLVAHEMSHPFQMRDAVDVYADARLMHEGGAEFLRWSVSLRQGWLTPLQAGAELDDALAACMLVTGERSWREMPARVIAASRLEYSCGLPAYVYALAARQGKGNPYARIDDFYARLRGGAKPDFAQAIECASAGCKARVLPALLDGQGPMHVQWAAMFKETGLATPRVEGLPLYGDAQALPAMVAACAARKEVALGLKDGATLLMQCRKPYRITQRFYAANMEKVAQGLARD